MGWCRHAALVAGNGYTAIQDCRHARFEIDLQTSDLDTSFALRTARADVDRSLTDLAVADLEVVDDCACAVHQRDAAVDRIPLRVVPGVPAAGPPHDNVILDTDARTSRGVDRHLPGTEEPVALNPDACQVARCRTERFDDPGESNPGDIPEQVVADHDIGGNHPLLPRGSPVAQDNAVPFGVLEGVALDQPVARLDQQAPTTVGTRSASHDLEVRAGQLQRIEGVGARHITEGRGVGRKPNHDRVTGRGALGLNDTNMPPDDAGRGIHHLQRVAFADVHRRAEPEATIRQPRDVAGKERRCMQVDAVIALVEEPRAAHSDAAANAMAEYAVGVG